MQNSLNMNENMNEQGRLSIYSGVINRIFATIIDLIVLFPIWIYIFYFSFGFELINVIVFMIHPIYHIFLNTFYGGSIGKLYVGLRVVKSDRTKVGLKEAILRSSIDIAFVTVLLAINILVHRKILNQSSVTNEVIEFNDFYPFYYIYIDMLYRNWMWVELLVLLSNSQRKALHDYIAHTMVIYHKYVVTPSLALHGKD